MEKVRQNWDKVVGYLGLLRSRPSDRPSCFAVVDVRYLNAGKGVAYFRWAARAYSCVLHKEGS
jgi:hypothetical protein